MVAPVEAVAHMPESLDAAEAAPLMCAGITTFNALRRNGGLPSDLVAIQGIGGLGHLGIQFAKKFGYRVAAIGRGTDSAALAKKLGADIFLDSVATDPAIAGVLQAVLTSRGADNATLAKKLGADVYIDSASTDPAARLKELGGARVILATAPSGKSMSALIGGLGANGTLVVVGAPSDPIEVSSASLIFGRKRIQGWSAGIPTDSEDTLRFAELTGVRAMIEKYPLEKAPEAYVRMMSGKAEFRVVLTM